MKLFGLAGWSGSGKTTLMVKLLPRLIRLGLSVSTVKHTHDRVDLDQPGKDTYRHREAGASEVVLVSASRWTLMHELRGQPEPSLADLLRHMTPVDLVMVEGFKHLGHDKLEVHRPGLGKPLLCRADPTIVAVATDGTLEDTGVSVFGLDDVDAIAGFVVAHVDLAPDGR
ncbi:MAG: molybdopterin-guanine dinucleotide biosynthesis protein B [Rhodospirillales bacterium]|nr:MAG: molybdopterin-guanine dinucleotide biosynthesis protein B [Rhodospirillales bacterium]